MAKPIKAYIPEGSDPQIEKFICCLMREGKKSIARGVFWDAMEVIKTRTKDAPLEVFSKALLNVTPLVEVRPKRVAGSVYQVPVEVTPKRQTALSIRWILDAARSRKGIPMAQRLAMNCLMLPPTRVLPSKRSRTCSRWRKRSRRSRTWQNRFPDRRIKLCKWFSLKEFR